MKKITLLTILAALISVQVSAAPLKLAEEKQLNVWKKELDKDSDYGKPAVKNCGYAVPVSIDENMVGPFMKANTSLSSYCAAPLATMGDMCADPTSKKHLTAKVKKITCKLGKEGEKKFEYKGKDELVFTVGVGASNLDAAAKEFFEN